MSGAPDYRESTFRHVDYSIKLPLGSFVILVVTVLVAAILQQALKWIMRWVSGKEFVKAAVEHIYKQTLLFGILSLFLTVIGEIVSDEETFRLFQWMHLVLFFYLVFYVLQITLLLLRFHAQMEWSGVLDIENSFHSFELKPTPAAFRMLRADISEGDKSYLYFVGYYLYLLRFGMALPNVDPYSFSFADYLRKSQRAWFLRLLGHELLTWFAILCVYLFILIRALIGGVTVQFIMYLVLVGIVCLGLFGLLYGDIQIQVYMAKRLYISDQQEECHSPFAPHSPTAEGAIKLRYYRSLLPAALSGNPFIAEEALFGAYHERIVQFLLEILLVCNAFFLSFITVHVWYVWWEVTIGYLLWFLAFIPTVFYLLFLPFILKDLAMLCVLKENDFDVAAIRRMMDKRVDEAIIETEIASVYAGLSPLGVAIEEGERSLPFRVHNEVLPVLPPPLPTRDGVGTGSWIRY